MKALSFQQSHAVPFCGPVTSSEREQYLVKKERAKWIAIHTVFVKGNDWGVEGCAPLIHISPVRGYVRLGKD